MLVQRAGGVFRRGVRGTAGVGQTVAAEAHAVKQKATHLREEPKELTDPTLAAKVETELFRDADVPKGQIDVNVQEGVVQLRGEVPSEDMMKALVEKARSVQGVLEVESLLHLPGQEAPMHH
jgi:osmotically-inducible protein OsmY